MIIRTGRDFRDRAGFFESGIPGFTLHEPGFGDP